MTSHNSIDADELKSPLRLQIDNFTDNMWGGDWIPALKGLTRPGGPVGESWEFSAHPAHPSLVAGLRGTATLNDLLAAAAPAVVGASAAARLRGKPPFLLKFIDSQDDLSVQVHPTDDYARDHEKDSGKSESWIIIDADATRGGGFIYLGFDPVRADGFSDSTAFAEAFLGAIQQANAQGPSDAPEVRSNAEQLVLPFLNRIAVKPGHVYDVPPGTIHAIGRGVRLLEIQQSSDLTYRVWDWNRPDAKKLKQGRREFRELHLDKARAVLDFRARAPHEYRRGPEELVLEGAGPRQREQLIVESEKRYAAERLRLESADAWLRVPAGFSVLTVLSGVAVIESGGKPWGELRPGASAMVPAAAADVRVRSGGSPVDIIRSYLPG